MSMFERIQLQTALYALIFIKQNLVISMLPSKTWKLLCLILSKSKYYLTPLARLMLQVVCECAHRDILSVVIAKLGLPHGDGPVLEALLSVLLPKSYCQVWCMEIRRRVRKKS